MLPFAFLFSNRGRGKKVLLKSCHVKLCRLCIFIQKSKQLIVYLALCLFVLVIFAILSLKNGNKLTCDQAFFFPKEKGGRTARSQVSNEQEKMNPLSSKPTLPEQNWR